LLVWWRRSARNQIETFVREVLVTRRRYVVLVLVLVLVRIRMSGM
jgi:hypothetical protein